MTYDRSAEMQHELIRHIVARLATIAPLNGRWIDLGCGTGIFTRECTRAGIPISRFVNLDIAFNPLLIIKSHIASSLCAQADIDHVPFITASFDGAIASSVLQWIPNLSNTLQAIASSLKPNGLLAFSMFVEGSFTELFSTQSLFGKSSPVHCPSIETFVRKLETAGFSSIDYTVVKKIHHAQDATSLLKNISSIGGTAIADTLLTRKKLLEFTKSYERNFRTPAGVPLTYRAIVGQCRKRTAP